MASRVIAEWVDIANGFLRSANWASTVASDAAYLTALEGVSNASLTIATYGLAQTGAPAASSSNYPLCTTTAVLNFLTAASTGIQVTIPAPVASIFGSDGVTVDPTSLPMVALIAAAIGFLQDGAGNVVTAFNTGVKSSRKVEQVG